MQKLKLGSKIISSERPAFVMGIVNVTPDSFYEKSRGGLESALKMISDGADLLDLGGESTRPGFEPVSAEEQIARLVPVIEAIRKESDIPISIDTRSSIVLQATLDAGADVLNDVSAMESDVNMAMVAAKNNCGVILMHGFGLNEEHNTKETIAQDVVNYLQERSRVAITAGVKKENIIWDPGIGFGKTNEENILLLKYTDKLLRDEYPLLMALSRKRMIGSMTGKPVAERGIGTVAANQYAVEKGAKLLRVHDVSETIDMLNVMKNLGL